MSRVSNQAMILTSAFKPQGENGSNNLHGMTLSSVVSLSVKPRTLIQFNLQVPSSTSIKLHELDWFAVHLLPPVSKSVELVRIFSKGSKYLSGNIEKIGEQVTHPFNDLEKKDFLLSSNIYKDEIRNKGVQPFHSLGESNHLSVSKELKTLKIDLPILSSAERVFICTKDQTFKIDDHEIWVGEVKDILIHDDFTHGNGKTGGLLYFDRQFHGLGSTIK